MAEQRPDARPEVAFELLVISAWNQSGGAFLHRLCDGHPAMGAYPFELQLGTADTQDGLSEWVQAKYRWPRFPPSSDRWPGRSLWQLFLDQELKERVFRPETSKFGGFDIQFDVELSQTAFQAYLSGRPRTTGVLVEAYVRSVFSGWSNRVSSGVERLVVGHCPVAILDADRALADMPGLKYLHLIRSPFAGYADTRRRIPGMTLERYCQRWGMVNLLGVHFATKYPERCRVLFFEQLLTDREATMRATAAWLGVGYDRSLLEPTWNGQPLTRILPFGGVPAVSVAYEQACLAELTPHEIDGIHRQLGWQLEVTGYLNRQTVDAGLV